MARLSGQVYQIKVTLDHVKPPVWRRVLVPANHTLAQLHDVLQAAMGWQDCHLHQFNVAGRTYGDPTVDDFGELDALDERRFELGRLLPDAGARLSYEYDFGDGWQHTLLIEQILPKVQGMRYPLCVDGRRACPPEDVGGIGGYAEFLRALAQPSHPEHDSYLEWIGGQFDANAFDLEQTNGWLRDLAKVDAWAFVTASLDDPLAPPGLLTMEASWRQLSAQGHDAAAEALAIRRDALSMLNYLHDNKVTGTSSLGNLTRKAVEEIADLFVNPPSLDERIGENAYRFRNEEEVKPIYFLHVLLAIADLIRGGRGKRWRLTETGQEFLAAPAAAQAWVLFAAWWFRTNWLIAYPYSDLHEGLLEGLAGKVRALLLDCPADTAVQFKPFADRVIEAMGWYRPVEDQAQAASSLRHTVRRIVVEPLAALGVVATNYEADDDEAWWLRWLESLQLTELGQGLLTLAASGADLPALGWSR